jgi:SNF2 family DNA or RNA helicase
MSAQTIRIVINDKRTRFAFFLPKHLNEYISAAPSRRFNPRLAAWILPRTRLNCQWIKAQLPRWEHLGVVISAETRDAIEETAVHRVPRREEWPERYQFRTVPMEHQRAALTKLFPLPYGALFCEMGTGKTKIAIDYACALWAYGFRSVVVICPKSIRFNWRREIEMHSTVKFSVHVHKTTREKALMAFDDGEALHWLIISTEALSQGRAEGQVLKWLAKRPAGHPALAVADESSAFKSHRSNRTKAVIRIGQQTERRLILTGTPVSLGVTDLFSQFQFLHEEVLGVGDFTAFKMRYCEMGGFEGKQIVGYKNLDEVLSNIGPYVFQARKAEVLKDLPPKLPAQARMVEANPEQRRCYEDLRRRFAYEFEDERKGGLTKVVVQNTLEKMLRLHELANGIRSTPIDQGAKRPRYEKEWISDAKVSELLRVLEDTDASVVIWCQYLLEQARVQQAISQAYGRPSLAYLAGGQTEEERTRAIDQFQSGETRFLVGSPRVGGMGINLTRGSLAIYTSNSFNLIDRMQSEDRLHRKGQKKSVGYIDLITEGTIDETINLALSEKRSFADYVQEAMAAGQNPFNDVHK